MKESTDKKLNKLYNDMNFFYKWFYIFTIIALLFGILFEFEMYYIGLAIAFVGTGRIIQRLAIRLHEIRKKDQEL